MGNYRFRLSDMMPNAWFYKLKDMSSSSKTRKCKKKLPTPITTTTTISQQKPYLSQPRYYSYHITTTEPPNRADKLCNSPINPKVSDTHFPDHYYSPRKSSSNTRKPSNRKSMYKPSPTTLVSAAGCTCRATFNSVWTTKPADHTSHHQYEDYSVSSTDVCSPEPASSDPFVDDRLALASWCGSCNCRLLTSSTNDDDIIIDMVDDKSFTRKIDKFDDFDMISELELPPILTKPPKFNLTTTEVTKITTSSSKLEETLSIKIVKEAGRIKAAKKKEPLSSNPVLPRKSSSSTSSTTTTTGVKLRTNTPRIKIQGYGRKSISSTTTTTNTSKSRTRKFAESFAIVKSSNDPERDFRDSMMEMIIENNIRASKDLEELLACYLLLNSNEYHDLIVKAFEQIWFDMTERRM